MSIFNSIWGYAAAALVSATVAGVGGWQLRDLSADRDLSQLQSEYDNYRTNVALDAARANEEALSELARMTSLYNELENKSRLAEEQRNQVSQQITLGLNDEQTKDDTIGPTLSEYLSQLRKYQRTRDNN